MEILNINKISLFKLYLILSLVFIPFNINNFLNLFTKYKSENIIDSNNIERYFEICNKEILLNNKKFKKNDNPKISIICPNHNRGQYILRLLRSIQNQFFDDIEIIFIDDYSNDNSVKLIEEYQKTDKRIILIKHKRNKGTLISRNEGILNSRGEYIIIPDSDDILSENILKMCYETSKKNNYEMIRFNIYKGKRNIFFNYIVNRLKAYTIYQPELSTYLFYALGFLEQIDFNLSNKFIKREAYIRALNSINKYYINQYMINLEDGIMNYMLYRSSKSFYFIKKIGYYYLQNNQSITIKPTENYDDKYRFIFLHLKFVFEYTKNTKYEKDMANSIFTRLSILFKDNFHLLTKDFKFYYEIIEMYLNSKFINNYNKSILKNLKNLLEKMKL